MSGAVQQAASALLAQLRQSGVTDAALSVVLESAVTARPGDATLRTALCSALWESGAHDAAIGHFRLLAAQHPSDMAVRGALAGALLQADAWAEGVALVDGLGAPVPDQAGLLHCYANGLLMLGRTGDAIAAARRRVALALDDPRAHFLLAHCLLASGAFAEGWAEYAWRWKMIDEAGATRWPRDPFRRPDPVSWGGRTVLLYSEQGNGDTLQCLRYVAPVLEHAARVVLAVQPGLMRLARLLAVPSDALTVVSVDEPTPAHDAAAPLFHLPWAFATTQDTIPGLIPYLAADPAEVLCWRARLAPLDGLRVGLVWAGAPHHARPDGEAMDRRRSMRLAALAPLAAVAGVSFVSLQKAATVAPPDGMVLHDWTDELHDFADTAALMAALDLVISVDTGPVHLAGALGRPVWLLNRFDSCWRWLRDRDDSPWYPTLRQFRQTAPGDWGSVVALVAVALSQAAATARAPGSGRPPS